MYGNIRAFRKRYTAFAASRSTYSDFALVEALEVQADFITGRLLTYFPSPISVRALAALTFSGVTTEGKTFTVGAKTYTFTDTPADANDVLIGSTAEECARNLYRAIIETGEAGYDADTTVNLDVDALSYTDGVLSLQARQYGPRGNNLALSTTDSGVTVTAFSGGTREFRVLEQMEYWATALALLGGKAASAQDGADSNSLVESIEKQLKDAWKMVETLGYLVDTTGSNLESASMCPISDCDYPSVDMGPAEFWRVDPDRIDWDRT